MAAIRLTRTHRILVGIVVTGAVVIAAIGFAGSYAAVRTLALHKGFGWFANVFPIGVDAGIVVLLALDLLLTWLRIPFPLLRQTAWLLTAATIAFNGAAAWPDPLGVGMHAIIPVLFVVSVEAARHAIGRIADITADKHMESVRITRWLLAPVPTFRLWRRMKLWELRSYEEVIRREQDRLVYRARLRARYGVAWRRRAPIEAVMPLRLAKYGVPLAETAEAGLEAAGIEVPEPGAKRLEAGAEATPALPKGAAGEGDGTGPTAAPGQQPAGAARQPARTAQEAQGPQDAAHDAAQGAQGPRGTDEFDLAIAQAQQAQEYERWLREGQFSGRQLSEQQAQRMRQFQQEQGDVNGWQGVPMSHDSPWFAPPLPAQGHPDAMAAQQWQDQGYDPEYPVDAVQYVQGGPPAEPRSPGPLPAPAPGAQAQQAPGAQARPAPNGARPPAPREAAAAEPGAQGAPAEQQVRVPAGPNRTRPLGNVGADSAPVPVPGPRQAESAVPGPPAEEFAAGLEPEPEPEFVTYPGAGLGLPDGVPAEEAYFAVYRHYVQTHGDFPNARQLVRALVDHYGGTGPEERELIAATRELRYRYNTATQSEYIP